jgi:hypothetical protein
MTGVWIGAALLILVVFPIVVVLLKGVLDAAAGSSRPSTRSPTPPRRGRPTSTRPRCC